VPENIVFQPCRRLEKTVANKKCGLARDELPELGIKINHWGGCEENAGLPLSAPTYWLALTGFQGVFCDSDRLLSLRG